MHDTQVTQQAQRYLPPLEMFKAREKMTMPSHGMVRGQLVTPTYHVDLPEEGGILSYHVGDKYSVKGWPFREAIYALDTIKRVVINTLKVLLSSPIRYLTATAAGVFLLFPSKQKRKAVDTAIGLFTDYTELVFERWGRTIEFQGPDGNNFCLESLHWEPKYFCDMVREIRKAGMDVAGDSLPYQRLVTVICMFFEFDDAYRYIAQDAFQLIYLEALTRDPGKELARVFQIMQSRGVGTSPKFEAIRRAIPFLFRISFIRDTIVEFFTKIDLPKVYLAEADWYRCLMWGNYEFGGIPGDIRLSQRMMIDAEWTYQQTKQQSQ